MNWKSPPSGDIRPSHRGNLKISTLWRPLPSGNLNTATLWLQKPPPSHNDLQTCGDLETSILRRPGDLHLAATRRPPSCGDLETSIRPRSGDLHSAETWRPPSLQQPGYPFTPPCSDPDICPLWRPGWEPTSWGDHVYWPQRPRENFSSC